MYNKQLSKIGALKLLWFLINGRIPEDYDLPKCCTVISSPNKYNSSSPLPSTKAMKTSNSVEIDLTPKKKQKQNALQKATIRDSGMRFILFLSVQYASMYSCIKIVRSKTLTVQNNWSASIPDFITESDGK